MSRKNLYLITEDTYNFKKGRVVEGFKYDDKIVCVPKDEGTNYFIKLEKTLPLNEALSASDIDKVKSIVRAILKAYFWRVYTRSSFLLK